jgi:hypothetical protein
MRRSLSLLALAIVMSLAACSNPAGPARDGGESGEEGECRDGVIVGSQTRCNG